MFKHEGPARTTKSNGLLAGYLAFVAGYANAAGVLLFGVFTSHVTGNVARLSEGVARHESASVGQAGAMVVLFLCGAVTASVLVETNLFRRTATAYGAALLVQGALLATFTLTGTAGLMSVAMGMQNSLVTRLSGSVVRTTHLTGVVTDLGIELARWVRWTWAGIGTARPGPPERNPATRPKPARSILLLTVVATFAAGGVLGALAVPHWGRLSIGLPAGAIFVAAVYAFAAR